MELAELNDIAVMAKDVYKPITVRLYDVELFASSGDVVQEHKSVSLAVARKIKAEALRHALRANIRETATFDNDENEIVFTEKTPAVEEKASTHAFITPVLTAAKIAERKRRNASKKRKYAVSIERHYTGIPQISEEARKALIAANGYKVFQNGKYVGSGMRSDVTQYIRTQIGSGVPLSAFALTWNGKKG
jgi:hypothetical protein